MLTDKQIDESWKEILWLSNKGLCELRRDYARAIERQVSTRRNPLNPGVIGEAGMSDEDFVTLRDRFALESISGLLTWDATVSTGNPRYAGVEGAKLLAKSAYAIADAMIEERTKNE